MSEFAAILITTPDTLGGTLRFAGTRISVETVVALIKKGISLEELKKDYFPHLSEDALQVAKLLAEFKETKRS